MKQLLERKKELFLVFCISLSLAIIALYQTYAYDVPNNISISTRPSIDSEFTFNLNGLESNIYTISLEAGETKLIDLTLENKNDYNLKYSLYTPQDIIDNTILGILNTSSSPSIGTINKQESITITVVAVNKTTSKVEYDISYLVGYEKGGNLTPTTGNLITTTYSYPNAPELDDNMIPIVYDKDLNSWVVADTTNTNPYYYWYEYYLKRWANIAIIDKNDIVDISNNENTGKNNNGIIKQGIYKLDGIDNYVNCGLSSYNFSNSISVVVRTKITDLSISPIISNLEDGGFALYLTDDNYIGATLISEKDNSYNYLKSDTKVSTDTWYTIILTYDNNNASLYINGKSVATTSLSGNVKPSTSPILVGKNPNNDNDYYSGEISDVILFNKSLSEDEINSYFTSQINNLSILNNLNNDAHGLILYYDFNTGKDIPIGTIINENNKKSQSLEIKSYYTWIPRYKYQVWNIEKEISQTTVTKEDNTIYSPYDKQQGINIVFENTKETTGTISCNYNNSSNIISSANLSEICLGKNGEYYTHPAFTFGDNQLTGFWIGKYESTIDEENNNIITKNNQIYNLTTNSIVDSLNLINNITNETNSYGFTPNTMDSHLIKNIEWGAVSYLAYSNYGLCQNGSCNKIGINNYLDENNNYQTGCGSVYNSSSSSNCNSYNTEEGQKASTTGNIYGVYDMSGGTSEYIMTTSIDINGNINENLKNIDSKYYDLYSYGTSNFDQLALNRTHLGDAIGEISLNSTLGWEDSTLQVPTDNNNILLRGGDANSKGTIFNSIEVTNTEETIIGIRTILAKKDTET